MKVKKRNTKVRGKHANKKKREYFKDVKTDARK